MSDPLLRISDLSIGFGNPEAGPVFTAAQEVEFDIHSSEVFALIGESGSGKSTVCKAILGLNEKALVKGSILFQGQEIVNATDQQLRQIRGGKIGMILQDTLNALDPRLTLRAQITESLMLGPGRLSAREIKARCLKALEDAGFRDPAEVIDKYPHQLSGGQAQRGVIAVVLARDPDLLIADEPTTALDVTTQAQFVGFIRELTQRTGKSVLIVTHDIGLVAEIADRIAVMRQGRLVETLDRDRLVSAPQHPYTRALVAASKHVLSEDELKQTKATAEREAAPIIMVKDLNRCFTSGGGLAARLTGARPRSVQAVDNVSFDITPGSFVGIGGESGSGKSSLARLICGMDQPESGQVLIAGQPVSRLSGKERGRLVQYVFQNPYSSMNPRHRILTQVRETLDILGEGSRAARTEKAREVLNLVGLEADHHDKFPHQLSGGQLQRAAIAAALVSEPKVLVCDEPVSALDVSIRSQVLTALLAVRRSLGTTVLMIGHDLSVFRSTCDRLIVIYRGRIVEDGPVDSVLEAPRHPYTRHLVNAAPQITTHRPERLSGSFPSDAGWRIHPTEIHEGL